MREREREMPNPKSDSGNVDVDVGGASRALSGLSIPDASSDSQSPKPTEEFSIPDASSDSQKPIPTQGSQMVDQTLNDQTLVERPKKKVIAPAWTLYEYRAMDTPEAEAKLRAEMKRDGVEVYRSKPLYFGAGTRRINSERRACVSPGPEAKCDICGVQHSRSINPAECRAWVTPCPEPKCDICGGKHWSSVCSYRVSVPPNARIVNEHDFQIVCECGRDIGDELCSKTCLPGRRRRVVSRHHAIDACFIEYLPPQDPDSIEYLRQGGYIQ